MLDGAVNLSFVLTGPRWALSLSDANASKKPSNTPVRLSRQKRFQMLFQLPNRSGNARQVTLWTAK